MAKKIFYRTNTVSLARHYEDGRVRSAGPIAADICNLEVGEW